MVRVYDKGAFYGVSLNEDEISRFTQRWPASGLDDLHTVYAEFEKQNGNLVDVTCNRRSKCEEFDGDALKALLTDAACVAENKLGINTGLGCEDMPDWKEYLPQRGRKTISCRDCSHGKQEFCCEGCDTPSKRPLGSCLHYDPRRSD